MSSSEQMTLPAEHVAWPRLTDDQRRGVNEVWDDTVVPALEQVDVLRRECDDARLEAQDARGALRWWQERAAWAAFHLPCHDEPHPRLRPLSAFGRTTGPGSVDGLYVDDEQMAA